MTGRFLGVVRRSAVLAAIIVGILGLLPFPSIATAYAPRLTLTSSTPGAETRVGHLPQELQLVFSDKILDAQIMLTGPDSATVPVDGVTVRNETARIALGVPDGAPGSYTVSYTASGTGGTAGNGSFSFTVTTGVKSGASAKPTRTPASPTAAPPVATTAAAAPADFVTTPAQPPAAAPTPSAGRPAWWTYAAVLLVVACVLVVFLGFSRNRIRPGNPAK
ncbi:copper resistance protein CopC [Dactylosporangium aurantiacum]|uniref:Copper resistance protein CopC n=1 Tax=Dactylosporangium aurantiacum TaxID=35754 RepID=A0A9Q9MHA9_9ACTN|nr:copper resistance protein CopC [Dactylosporangium aurantiacum]MDG6108951.1 copper resistance protein CopC [Dactylosporangium aurantiacum]UWZ56544.1 copper resistance protein CopC [Dactylosporangium aurantiacum]